MFTCPLASVARLREVAALLSRSTLLGVVPQPTDSWLSETTCPRAPGVAAAD